MTEPHRIAVPMEQPGPVLAVIGVVGLILIGGAFYLGAATALQQQPEAPAGAVNISPAAQQPTRNAEGEVLPVQPGEPEENQPIINAPDPGSPQALDPTIPTATAPAGLPEAAKGGEPGTTPAAEKGGDGR